MDGLVPFSASGVSSGVLLGGVEEVLRHRIFKVNVGEGGTRNYQDIGLKKLPNSSRVAA